MYNRFDYCKVINLLTGFLGGFHETLGICEPLCPSLISWRFLPDNSNSKAAWKTWGRFNGHILHRHLSINEVNAVCPPSNATREPCICILPFKDLIVGQGLGDSENKQQGVISASVVLTKLRCGAVALLRVTLRCSKAPRGARDQECVEGWRRLRGGSTAGRQLRSIPACSNTEQIYFTEIQVSRIGLSTQATAAISVAQFWVWLTEQLIIRHTIDKELDSKTEHNLKLLLKQGQQCGERCRLTPGRGIWNPAWPIARGGWNLFKAAICVKQQNDQQPRPLWIRDNMRCPTP